MSDVLDFTAVRLGSRYRDEISGFTGVATGAAGYEDGRRMILLTRRDSTGKPEDVWVSLTRVVAADQPASPTAGVL